MLSKPRILSLSSTRLINSIKHEHSCKILYILYCLFLAALWSSDWKGLATFLMCVLFPSVFIEGHVKYLIVLNSDFCLLPFFTSYTVFKLKTPSGFGCCPFLCGRSFAVDFLSVVTPIVGFCNSFMFCCVLCCVHSSFCNHIHGEERVGCFALYVILVSRVIVGWLFITMPQG